MTLRAVARVSSGSGPVELDEQRDEVEVGLQLAQQLRLEQQLVQVEALDGVALQHLHDRRREVPADVAQPAGDRRRRAGQPARPARCPGRAATSGRRARRGRRRCGGRRRRSSAPVPSASPPPSTSRHRRSRSVSETRAVDARRRRSPSRGRPRAGQAEHRPHGGQPGPARASSMSSPIGATRSTATGGQQQAELTALGRLERRRTCGAAGRRCPRRRPAAATAIHASTMASSWTSWSSTVPLPARNPSTNAAPAGRRRARRERPTEAGLDVGRRPAPAIVQQPRRPALDQPVDPPPVGQPLQHRPAASRGGPGGRRRPAPAWTALMRSISARAGVVVEPFGRPGSPATTRTTSSSNTTRSDAPSVPRTSP